MSKALSRLRFASGTAATIAAASTLTRVNAAQFSMKLGHDLPVEHPIHVRSVQMWKAVREQTKGRLDVSVFPDNQLGGDSAMISQIRSGALQFMIIGSGPLSGLVPLCAIEATPFAWRSYADALKAMNGRLGAYVRYSIREKSGLITFPNKWPLGFHEITTSNRPIHNADDLNGLKIRIAPSIIVIDAFKVLGASPAPTNLAEAYVGMQTHLVDGQASSRYSTIEFGHYYEVQKFLSVTNHIWAAYWLAINPDAWNSLPSDVQDVVQRNAAKYALLQSQDSQVLDAALANKLARQGLIFNSCNKDSFRTRLGSGFYAKWRSEFGETAWSLMTEVAGNIG